MGHEDNPPGETFKNRIYLEIGETGSGVKIPKKGKLKAGDRFPENSNDNRYWSYMPKP